MNNMTLQLQVPDLTYRTLRRVAVRSRRTEDEVVLDVLQEYFAKTAVSDSLLGLFADDPALMDTITHAAMVDREEAQLRVEDAASG